METLNKEFWEKRDAAMKRFMASKERKRKRMAELEQMLRQDYLARTGEIGRASCRERVSSPV